MGNKNQPNKFGFPPAVSREKNPAAFLFLESNEKEPSPRLFFPAPATIQY
jgi:hypothetical protein